MDTLNNVKNHLNNKTVVHLSMLAFAITSTLNIAGFFVATEHNPIVAASIGLALGGGLMAVSIYLSKQEFGKGVSFWTLLVATLAMAILSGQIQSMGYQLHELDVFTSRLLGFAPPIVAEVLLALSVSLAERTEREQIQKDSKRFIKDSVAEAMTTAFRSVDASRIQKHIEKSVDGVIRAFVDDALGEMMDELNGRKEVAQNDIVVVQPASATVQPTVQPIAQLEAVQVEQETPVVHENIEQSGVNSEQSSVLDTGRQIAIEQKRSAKVERQSQLLHILMTELNNSPADELNKSALGERLGVKHTTIGRDIEDLIAQQRLSVNGHIEVL